MTQHYTRALKRLPLALALLGASGYSLAVDWTGYFRAGPGLTSNATSRACYGLNGGSSGMKYRLGNECDFYGEFQLSQGFKKDGIDYKVTLMTDHYTAATDTNGDGLKIAQMFAEAKGFDIAPEATFWIGKERGRRGDVHIVDTYFTEMVGVGAGAKGFKVGPGALGVARGDVHIVDTYFTEMVGVGAGAKGFKVGPGALGVAYYKTEASAVLPGHRSNIEWVGIDSNPGGKLNVFATVTKGQFAGGTKGAGLAIRHDQEKLLGSSLNNTLWLQYAQGSAGLNSNFGDLTAGSKAKSYRIVESINWQQGPFGGQALILLAREKNKLGISTKSFSVGGRASYALSRHFKMVGELGVSQYKPDGGQTARLTKLTIAPTLSVGSDFFSRPEFRLYATMAKWNKAAGNVTGQAAFDDKTSGNSLGAQVEWWF
ncbi:maltoporin [Paucibacter sp. XJ19-41]|uniref:maltoporin n=1 Tax=Paucibacter sp. XJ19-41 TaxID=2927824 RepID=UPI00234BA1A5|nr:carbohydrate porin [Paucibacter sp. XJ19-41]MDC6169679.1 carbohydrate porin [Paucibacter sp. XJ19-41]